LSVDLEAAARRAVDAALTAGASDAEAWVERSAERSIRVYDGRVESLTDATSAGLGVRAFVDGQVGYSYGTDMSDDGLEAVAGAAQAAAAIADTDEYAGLPDSCGATRVDGLYSPGLAGWTTERKIELALAIERAARAHPGVSQVESAVYSDGEGAVALANSRGFSGTYEVTSAWAYCSAFAGEGADLMTGLGVGIGRDPTAIDPQAVGGEAAERALALVGARQPRSRRCPVVLDAFVAASFVGFIGGMLSADAVQRGRSLFADKEGEEVGAPLLRIVDDGTDPDGFASAPFDGEGSPRRRTPLIEDGRLASFLYDARTARRGGRETTANAERGSYRTPPRVGTSNLVIDPGEATLEQLLARAGDGLYVTDVAGLHSGVNPVSGTFSVGATGILIENGELAAPAREMTIASDLVTMLKGVAELGSQPRWVPFGGSVKAVPLLLSEMSVSGA
jgi:PmbA protein